MKLENVLNSGKKGLKKSLLAGVLLIGPYLSGCASESKGYDYITTSEFDSYGNISANDGYYYIRYPNRARPLRSSITTSEIDGYGE